MDPYFVSRPICFVAATTQEVAPLLKRFKISYEEKPVWETQPQYYQIADLYSILITGVGQKKIEESLPLIKKISPHTLFINLGIVGSSSRNLSLHSLTTIKQIRYSNKSIDLDLKSIDNRIHGLLDKMPQMALKTFDEPQFKPKFENQDFLIDMEAFHLYRHLEDQNQKVLIIKSVSDYGDSIQTLKQNLPACAIKLSDLAVQILEAYMTKGKTT